jgi:hypothetical protein
MPLASKELPESGTRWAFLVLAVPEEEGISFELDPWHDAEAVG